MERRNHNIRFNLQNEEAKKAWEYLHSKEVEKDFKSLNTFVIIAINDYYERHLKIKADFYFEKEKKKMPLQNEWCSKRSLQIFRHLPEYIRCSRVC